MPETPKPIYDPSNGLSDKVFLLMLPTSFVCILIGVADPLINALVHAIGSRQLDWFPRFILNIIGPMDIAQHLRTDDFLAFSFLAAIMSLLTAFALSAVTLVIAWLFDNPVKQGPT